MHFHMPATCSKLKQAVAPKPAKCGSFFSSLLRLSCDRFGLSLALSPSPLHLCCLRSPLLALVLSDSTLSAGRIIDRLVAVINPAQALCPTSPPLRVRRRRNAAASSATFTCPAAPKSIHLVYDTWLKSLFRFCLFTIVSFTFSTQQIISRSDSFRFNSSLV